MRSTLTRIGEYLAAEPVRISAGLRLPLIALIGVLVWIWEVDHWLPELYAVILGLYAIAAVVWLVAVLRGPVPRWADWASTGIDLVVILSLCLVSGGATAALLPVFFLLPISVAFQDRPLMTAAIGTLTAAGYLAVWIFYSKHDDRMGLPNMVYTHFGFLVWLAVATTVLCFVLVRRQERVHALQEVRRQLVSEAMQSDERHNREVAEGLHDGPLQTLLAAPADALAARTRLVRRERALRSRPALLHGPDHAPFAHRRSSWETSGWYNRNAQRFRRDRRCSPSPKSRRTVVSSRSPSQSDSANGWGATVPR